MRSGINRSSPKCVAFNMISEEIALAEPYELGPLWNSGKINRNCPDKIKCQILSRQIFVSSFASAWKISKLSNSVNFWSAWAHKSGQHSLPMDKNSDRQDSSEVVQWKYVNPRVSQKKRKDNYSPSSDNKTNPVQLHVFGSFCDKWSASETRLCLFGRFCQVFTRLDKFCLKCVRRFASSKFCQVTSQQHLLSLSDERSLFQAFIQ